MGIKPIRFTKLQYSSPLFQRTVFFIYLMYLHGWCTQHHLWWAPTMGNSSCLGARLTSCWAIVWPAFAQLVFVLAFSAAVLDCNACEVPFQRYICRQGSTCIVQVMHNATLFVPVVLWGGARDLLWRGNFSRYYGENDSICFYCGLSALNKNRLLVERFQMQICFIWLSMATK